MIDIISQTVRALHLQLGWSTLLGITVKTSIVDIIIQHLSTCWINNKRKRMFDVYGLDTKTVHITFITWNS